MSKVVLTFDTNEKSLTATMDGRELTDLADVMFYRTGKTSFHMAVVQRTESAENGTVVYTQTCANEQALASLGKPSRLSGDALEQARAGIAALFMPEARTEARGEARE